MYIVSQDGTQLINAEYPERFCLAEKPDATLVLASYRDDRPPVTLARYRGPEEAKDALWQLLTAMTGKQSCFQLPADWTYDRAPVTRDARVKRRGGS